MARRIIWKLHPQLGLALPSAKVLGEREASGAQDAPADPGHLPQNWFDRA